MSLLLQVKNQNRLAWYYHPLRRMRVNHHAKTLAKAMNKGQARFVHDFLSNNVLASSAAYLRSMGVIQIQKNGWLPGVSIENGHLGTQEIERPDVEHAALAQLASHNEDLAGPRQFAAVRFNEEGEPRVVLVASNGDMFAGSARTEAYNITLQHSSFNEFYVGSASIHAAGNMQRALPFEGELSLFPMVMPDRRYEAESFEELKSEIPSIIIKDETRPSSPLGLSSVLMGGINLGVKRLYDLVFDNARFLLAHVAGKVRDDFSVFLGKSDRYIKFFGRPLVGYRTMEQFTKEEPKKSQFMFLSKPLDREACEAQPTPILMVERSTGRVKYIFPPARRGSHMESLMKKMSAKMAAGVSGKEMAAYFSQIPAGALTEEENAQLEVFKGLADQPDVEKTEWVFMEVIPGAFVAQKAWLDRLTTKLGELSEKYRWCTSGKEMSSVLDGRYTLDDLVYLAMVSSDQGHFNSGYVAKFGKLGQVIDRRYLQEVYTLVRKEIFQGEKMFAINLGEATEVISFSDQKVVDAGGQTVAVRPGERAYVDIVNAMLTYNREAEEEWHYWRTALGIETDRKVVKHSSRGAYKWWKPSTWLHPFARDQIIINSTLSSNFQPKGKIFCVNSQVTAEAAVSVTAPFIAVNSRVQLSGRLQNSNGGIFAYSYDNVGPAVGDTQLAAAGTYATVVQVGNLSGSGRAAGASNLRVEFPGKDIHGEAALAKRAAIHKQYLAGLAPDETARREETVLRSNLQVLARDRQTRADDTI